MFSSILHQQIVGCKRHLYVILAPLSTTQHASSEASCQYRCKPHLANPRLIRATDTSEVCQQTLHAPHVGLPSRWPRPRSSRLISQRLLPRSCLLCLVPLPLPFISQPPSSPSNLRRRICSYTYPLRSSRESAIFFIRCVSFFGALEHPTF